MGGFTYPGWAGRAMSMACAILLFAPTSACGTSGTQRSDVETSVENPLFALLNAADVIVASPTVVGGNVVIVRDRTDSQGQIIRLDPEKLYRGVRHERAIALDLSRLAFRLQSGAKVVAGLRYNATEPRVPWTFVAGRDGILIDNGDTLERIRPDGTLEAVERHDARCAFGDRPCYVQVLRSRGIITPAQRASLDRARILDPDLALFYLIAFRSNRVRQFPVENCSALRWTCASVSVYRRLLHFGNVI